MNTKSRIVSIVVMAGSFAAEAAMDVTGRAFTAVNGLQQVEARLDDGDQVVGSTAGVIAVVKVKQRSRSVTSGPIAMR